MSYAHADHGQDHAPQSFWTRYVWSQDHKVIAVQYSLTAIAIGLVGLVLSNLMRLQLINASIDGINVGSGEQFAAMNRFIAERGLKPVIDRTFAFEEAEAAYAHLASGQHFGKVVIGF
jgi:NADPH:quinone reductase-like Zn-dependent oxidoreductase